MLLLWDPKDQLEGQGHKQSNEMKDVQRTITELVKERKLQLFGHICWMDDTKLIDCYARHDGGQQTSWGCSC